MSQPNYTFEKMFTNKLLLLAVNDDTNITHFLLVHEQDYLPIKTCIQCTINICVQHVQTSGISDVSSSG